MLNTSDAQTRHAIEQQLGTDNRTKDATIAVACVAGQVTLTGDVSSAVTKSAAEEIARAAPGVMLVLNEVHIR